MTSVTSYGGGYAIFTAAGHGLVAGDAAVIAGTAQYDGDYVVLEAVGGSITVAPRYQAETFTNAAVGLRVTSVTNVVPDVAAITVAGSAYSDGDPVVIGGSTNYNGSFIVRSPAGDTFGLSPAFVTGALAGTPRVNGTITLTAVTNSGGSARFGATGHGLNPGDPATISGITGALSVYNGVYVVMSVPDVNTFEVVRKYVAEDFTNAVAGKSLTTVAAGTGGSALFTATANGFADKASVWIGGTTRYNGHYLVTPVTADTFQVGVSFLSGVTNNARVNGRLLTAFADAGDKSTAFTAPSHGLGVGSAATVTGTLNYNGNYVVSKVVDANTFELAPPYVAETFTTATVGTPLTKVRPFVGNLLLASFTAPAHGLVVGNSATFSGTGVYDRDYVVTLRETANDLQVTPRWLGSLTAGATLNGSALQGVADGGVAGTQFTTFTNHGLSVGSFATVVGTVNYNGEYVVTNVVNSQTVEVAERCITPLAGTVNGTALSSVFADLNQQAVFTAVGHTLTVGALAAISGTAAYDGLYVVTAVSGSTFRVAPRYAVQQFLGAYANGTALQSVANYLPDGSAIFAAPGNTFTVGWPVTITGTPTYNGDYVVMAISVNGVPGTFRVAPRRVNMTFANVNGTPLDSVAPAGGNQPLFTAPGHVLSVGDFCTIGGTVNYEGDYVVTASDTTAGTFEVARRSPAPAVAGTVNGTPLASVADAGDHSAVFTTTAPHGLNPGDLATIAGTTSYNGTYVVTAAPDAVTLQVGPRCVPAVYLLAGINTTALATVSDAGDRTALLSAPNHGLARGDFVTLNGPTGYNGLFVVTMVAGDTFTVGSRYVAETFAGATANSASLVSVSPDTDGTAIFSTAAAHGLINGDHVSINNTTNYDGGYVVTAATATTFKVLLRIADTPRIERLVVEVRDTGTANFDISDLIDPALQTPRQNHDGGGCGIAVYVDNPIKGQQGIFDEYDVRMPMSAIPYISGPPQLPTQLWLNFVPETVLADPGNHLVGTGGAADQASGLCPALGTDAVFQDRVGGTAQVYDPGIDAAWIDVNHSGAYESGVIATTDQGAEAGNDFFLVVRPTDYMDPGDDFTLQVYNVWFGHDKLSTSTGNTHITTRFTTHRMRNSVVTNDVFTDEVTPGLLTQPNQGPFAAMGVNVFDPTGAGRLQSMRVYLNPQGNYNPNDLLATLLGGATGGVSLWNVAANTNIPIQPGTWQDEATAALVYHEVRVPPTSPVVVPTGTVLNWFAFAENVCWGDNDQDGKWGVGDSLWINDSAVVESSVRYNHGYDTPLVATAANDGDSGVILQHSLYGFAYYDTGDGAGGAPNGLLDLDEDIFFLGPGRSTLGWYTDLVLVTPATLPTTDTAGNAGKDFEVRFRTNPNPPIFGTLGWTFSIPNQSVTYSTGHSSANGNLTTGLIRLEVVPTTISDFTASRGAGRVTLNWTLPVSTFTSVFIVRTPTTLPGVPEVPRLGVSYAVGQPVGAGTVVYMGSSNTFVDNGVVNGTPYYYWAFAGDRAPTGAGLEDMVQATPWPVTPTEDSTPPGVVTSLTATPGNNSVTFTWNDPLDLDLAEILIVRSSTAYPANRPADETPYAIGADLGDGIVVGKAAAGAQTFVDDGNAAPFVAAPLNGTTYYYTFYTRDGFLNYSAAARINCMPSDGTAVAPRPVTSFGLSVVIDAFGNHDVNLAWNWPTPIGTPETGLVIVRNFGGSITGTPSAGRQYVVGDALATGETGTVVAIVTGTGSVTYTDQDVMGGGTYYYAAFTFNGTLDYSSGAYSSQVISSAVVTYADLTTVGQTIESDSAATAVIGINVYDNNQAAVLGSVTVQFNRLGNNSIYDLADINGSTTTSGVALYRDSNGNGVFNAGVDALVPFSLGSGWSRGRPGIYDRKMDTPILDLTNWRAVDGVAGIQTGVYYLDSNNNGVWDPGEDIWTGANPYAGAPASVLLYTGGVTDVVAGVSSGIQTGLRYYDEDGSNSYTPGESLWRDESWPRMLTMNLTSGLDVPNTDTGADLGADLFVVIRTSHTIRYGTQVQLAVPGTFGLTFFGEEAGVAGLTTNAITCRIPTTLSNLVAANQTIAVSSPSTAVIGMDIADPSQTVDSLTLDLLNVGGDFDITPSDFISYLAADQEGPVSFWRDMRPVAPSSLGGVITAVAADGSRTQVTVTGLDFASLGVRVGDIVRRVDVGGTTTAAVTSLQSTVTANDTLVFLDGLSGVGGDHSLDAGDLFVVETRFLVPSSPMINVANAASYPTSGLLRLGRELISYNGKDANQNLLNVVRGVQGTTAAVSSHPVGESLRVIGMTTTLANDLTAGATTVDLAVGEGPRFQDPNLGYTAYVRVGNEVIGYRDRLNDQLLQCTRGSKGTDAVPHIAGATVADAMPLTLLTDLAVGGTTVDVAERPFDPAAKTGIGHVTIGLEVVSYTSVMRLPVGWRLSGCVRGVSGSGAVAHSAGDAVVQGRPGTFDLESDSLVFLASLPASGMSIPLNIRNQPLSPMIDDIADFFVTVKTSSSASHNDDFQVRLAAGALDFSVPATGDSQRGITSNTLRVNAQDTTAPVITQVRTLDLNHNGMVDHVLVTFSEPVRDASLTGYVSEAIAFLTSHWLLQGYTGVGIDPNGTAGMSDVADDSRLVLYLDERAINIPTNWLGDTGALLDLTTVGATLTDLSTNPAPNLLNGGVDYLAGQLLPVTVDGAAPVLVDAFSDRPLTLAGEIEAGTVITLRFSEPVTSLDVARLLLTDLVSSSDGIVPLSNGFDGVPGGAVASITAGGDIAFTFAAESTSGNKWTEDATLNLDATTISEGDIVDAVGFNALPAPLAVPIRGLGSVMVVSAETGDVDRNGRIDFVRITFDRPVNDATIQGYPGTGGRIDAAANGNHFQVAGRGSVMIDLDGPTGTDPANNNVLYLVFGEGGAPDTADDPTLTISAARLRSLDGEYTRDYSAPTTDAAPPVMIDVVTYDMDANGAVDTALVEFSEPVADATADAGDFTIGGMTVDTVVTGLAAFVPVYPNVADDQVLVLQITVPANEVLGTDFKTVAYTQDDDGLDLADPLGNEMVSDSDGGRWGNKLDAARPTIQSARTLTDASVQVTFSENVLGVTTAMLKLNSGALSLATMVQTGPRTYVWSAPAGNARWNTDANGAGAGDTDNSDGYQSTDSLGTPRTVVPNLTVVGSAFSDAWGNANLAITNSLLTTDGTAPVVVAVTTLDSAPTDGRVDSALVVLSEPMADASIIPAQFGIGGVVGTTMVTGLVASDQAFTISHGGVAGTDLKRVAYVAGIAADVRGNLLASSADLGVVSKTDLAKPYLLSATSRSDRSMELRFSELVIAPAAAALTVNGGVINFTTVDATANPTILWGGADATWNTDATGLSVGTGTDSAGVSRAAMLDLGILADQILDLAGTPNGNSLIATATATDGAPPVVTRLYSDVVPGSTHTLGQLVPVLVDFSERVTVQNGSPTLLIQVSDTAQRTLTYWSGSGSRSLRFNYTVGVDDNRLNPDYLDCPATDSLAFAGSSITDTAPIPNRAVLTLPTPGAEYVGAYGPLYGHHIQIDTVPPEVLVAETVDHDTLKVTFSELIRNDADQILAALPSIGISDGGTPEGMLPFDAVSVDAANSVTTTGAGPLSVVYFHMTNAAKRWNTDATGTSAGVGTDGGGVTRTAIPRLFVPVAILRDLVDNPIADTVFSTTADKAPPVVLGGLYRDTNANGRVDTLEVRFSEGVNQSGTAGWTLTPNDLPLDATLGAFTYPNGRVIAIAVTATAPGTGVDDLAAETEPGLGFDDGGVGLVRDRSAAANPVAPFAIGLADQAGPVLVAAELATPSVARLTFSEKLEAGTVDVAGTDFLHSLSTVTAAATVDAWAGARLRLNPALDQTAASTVRFAVAATVTDSLPEGNANADVAPVSIAPYDTRVYMSGPATDVMHRGALPIDVTGLVDVLNALPEDDLDRWDLYLVQGQDGTRLPIADASTLHLNGADTPVLPAGVLGSFTPDTDAVNGVYHYTLVLQVAFTTAEAPLLVYRKVAIAKDLAETGQVNDGASADIEFQRSTTQLTANWSGVALAGVVTARYEVAYSTDPANYPSLPADWTDVGLATSFTLPALTLNGATTHYFKVRALDAGGNVIAVQTSDGVTVDITGPAGTLARDGADPANELAWIIQNRMIVANWDAFIDPGSVDEEPDPTPLTGSGVASYGLAVYRIVGVADPTSAETNDVMVGSGYTNVGNVLTAQLDLGVGALIHAASYYVAVRATDAVGNTGVPVYSDGAKVDLGAPQPTTIRDGSIPGVDIDLTNSTNALSANWAPFTDDVSGPPTHALTYWYRAVTGLDKVTAWQTHATNSALNQARQHFTSVRLADGRLLVAGGWTGTQVLNSTEIFNPATGQWTVVRPMATPRMNAAGVLLPSGKVVVAGGENTNDYLASIEIYDPTDDSWSTASSPLATKRAQFSAVTLNGVVLFMGGRSTTQPAPSLDGDCLASIEQFDPSSGVVSALGNLSEPRRGAKAVVLYDDLARSVVKGILVIGGETATGFSAAVDMYTPGVGWNVSNLARPRAQFATCIVPLADGRDGRLLVLGGRNMVNGKLSSVEVFDPASGTWSELPTGMGTPRAAFGAVWIESENYVLVAGGLAGTDGTGDVDLASCETYDPSTGAWGAATPLNVRRGYHGLTAFDNGLVLAYGGLANYSFAKANEWRRYAVKASNWASYSSAENTNPIVVPPLSFPAAPGPGSLVAGETYYIQVRASDTAGNAGAIVASDGVVVDFTAPTVVVTAPNGPTNVSPLLFTVTFSEDVTGFDSTDLVCGNGTVTAFAGLAGKTFQVTVTPTTTDGAVTLAVAGAMVTDVAGNPNGASNVASVTFKSTGPTCILSGPVSPNRLVTMPFTATFAEVITGFTGATKVSVVNGRVTTAPTSTDGKVFTFAVSPSVEGEVKVTVLAGAGKDSLGNASQASDEVVVVYDATAPVATLTDAPAALTSSNQIDITVAGVEVVRYTYTLDGSAESAETGTGTHILAAALAEGPHALRVWGIDAAGNKQVSPTTLSWTVDTVAPIATLSGLPGTQSKNPDLRLTVGGIGVTKYTYSLDGAAEGAAVSVTTALVELGLLDGPHTIQVWGIDAANNKQAAPTQYAWTVDTVAPVATLTSLSGAVTFENPIRYRMAFDEDVADFVAADLTVNGTVVDFLAVSAREYTFGVVPTAARGIETTVTVTLAAANVHDAAGNASTGATLAVLFYTEPPARVTLVASATEVGVGDSFTVSVYVKELSAAANGFRGGPIDLQFTTDQADVNTLLPFNPASILSSQFTSIFTSGTLSETGGLIDELGGATTASNLGEGEVAGEDAAGVLYAVVPFVATAPGAFNMAAAAATAGLTLTPPVGTLPVALVDYGQQVTVLVTTQVTLSIVDSASFAENGGTTTLEVRLGDVAKEDVTVALSFAGSATLDSDYTAVPATVIIASGSNSATVTITGLDDAVYEGAETVVVAISTVNSASGAYTESGTQEVSLTVTDDDFAPGDIAGGDGIVDMSDLIAFVGHYGAIDDPGKTDEEDNYSAACDLDHDGDVDFYDLNIFIGLYGTNYNTPGRATRTTSSRAASSTAVMTLQGPAEVTVGETFTVDVYVQTNDSAGFGGGAFDVAFPAGNLAYAGAFVSGDIIQAPYNSIATTGSLGAGLVDELGGVTIQSGKGYTAPVLFARLQFVATAAGASTVRLASGKDPLTTVGNGPIPTANTTFGSLPVTVIGPVDDGPFSSSLQVHRGAGTTTLNYGRKLGASADAVPADGDLPAIALPDGSGAHFLVSGGVNTQLASDYRPLATTTIWKLTVTVPKASTWQVAWDGSGLPTTGSAVLIPSNAAWEATGPQTNLRLAGSRDLVNEGAELATFRFLVVVSENVQVTYNLCRGWNLIGVPLEADADSVAAFLADEHLWVIYEWSEATGYTIPSTLKAGRGYWVYSLTDGVSVSLTGIPRVGSVAVTSGWNLVASGKDGAEDPGSSNAAVMSSWMWDALSLAYVQPGQGGIPATCGVWVFVSEDTVIWNSR